MRFLLDTHTFLWWVDGSPALSDEASKVIRNPRNDCFLSMASCWEMAIKSSIGKLTLVMSVERFVAEQIAEDGFVLLPIEFRHVCKVESLPFYHRDPFDRLLVAQSITEKMAIISADTTLDQYGVRRIW
ncbi:MAG: type II toxin-antitoxin system VapC family toxin [Trichlorobacter sp.]|uniref:type II toxin-antitoxin system VapC family toxin n=1 Tax=Trichlorobacter sp. TaxID=2911007 RepID=UPI00256914DF|nr:type II toxin-antitoxin system VapC family toxin [Trichlorobacter sp.]MDK9719031.1 type II toxin-antitoxin system VapC family toxin [Trichlorobacter sp.]